MRGFRFLRGFRELDCDRTPSVPVLLESAGEPFSCPFSRHSWMMMMPFYSVKSQCKEICVLVFGFSHF